MPPVRSETRDRIIEAARELFYSQGYHATGLAQILKEAARETLPFVEERVRLQAARDTLLRPTSAGDSTESLLRPAANTQSEGELLLRAATESAES